MSSVKVYKARRISAGRASGPALVTKERVGFRGFVNIEQGTFTGGMGKLEGASFAGAVLIFPSSKGSTLWSITLDATCRCGNAPAAFINSKIDPFVVLGCVLQDIPLVQVEDLSIFDQIKNGDTLTVDADGGEVIIGKAF
ncbi:aconitase X swivel domain-containing protein [Chloroflexota bacterium]